MKEPSRKELWDFASLIVQKQKAVLEIDFNPDDNDWSDVEGEWFEALCDLLKIEP